MATTSEQQVQATEPAANPGRSPYPRFDDCPICGYTYGTVGMDGVTEHEVMTSCGHFLGNHCYYKWVQMELRKTCPFCQRTQVYSKCGCMIPAQKVAEAAPFLVEGKRPQWCKRCARRFVPEREELVGLRQTAAALQARIGRVTVRSRPEDFEDPQKRACFRSCGICGGRWRRFMSRRMKRLRMSSKTSIFDGEVRRNLLLTVILPFALVVQALLSSFPFQTCCK